MSKKKTLEILNTLTASNRKSGFGENKLNNTICTTELREIKDPLETMYRSKRRAPKKCRTNSRGDGKNAHQVMKK
jgi:hypothetical protein